MAKVALQSGGADAFSPPQAAAVDAIQVLKNGLAKGFAGPAARAACRAGVDDPGGRTPAMPFVSFHLQNRMAKSQILMAQPALIDPLAAQASASAVGAGSRTLITRRDPYLSLFHLYGCNLVPGRPSTI